MSDSRVFQTRIDDLETVLRWTHNHLKMHNLTGKHFRRFELAIEEAIVNVISYAYPQANGVFELTISKSSDQKYIEVCIKDQGRAFDPVNVPNKIDIETSIDSRKTGGLGIHFIRELTDKLTYERKDGSNILTLSVLAP